MVFNSMLTNLLQGDFTVDPVTITDEAIVKDGKIYTYFGVFPALFRTLFLPFIDIERLSVARFSVFTALTISLIFQVKTWLTVFATVESSSFSRHALLIVIISLLGSSPLLFLASNATVYHEPILWASAMASIFNYVLVCAAIDKQRIGTDRLYILSIVAGTALLNRPNVAIGLYIGLLLLMSIDFIYRRQKERGGGKINRSYYNDLLRLLGPLLLLGLFGFSYLAINYGRWDDPFISIYYEGYAPTMGNPARLKSYMDFGIFHWKRIPINLEYYLVGSQELSDQLLKSLNIGYDWIESPRSSMLLSTPVFFILSTIGVVTIIYESLKKINNNIYISIGLIGEGIAFLLVLSFHALTLRYRMDLWTFISLAAVVGFQHISVLESCLNKITRPILFTTAWFAVIVGILSSHIALFQYKMSWFSLQKPSKPILEFLQQAVDASHQLMLWPF